MESELREELHARRDIFITRRLKFMALYHSIVITEGASDPKLPFRIRIGRINKVLADRIERLRFRAEGPVDKVKLTQRLRRDREVSESLEERYKALCKHDGTLPIYLIGHYSLRELPFEELFTTYRNHFRLKVFVLKGLECSHPGCKRVAARLIETMSPSGSVHLDLFTDKLQHMNVDHIVPISKGGGDEMTNRQPMCAFHNGRKGNKMPTNYELQCVY